MIEYGIDLGTTNSAIARQRGGRVTLLPGEDGSGVLLPSAVHVGRDGEVRVGEAARRAGGADPANTAIEFKRLMGTSETVSFPASGRRMKAEELSSEVLKHLVARTVTRGAEQPPRAAVITVPAMFQLPQCEATRLAAELAGIVHAPLLQEPIAAAIAYSGSGELGDGQWMVYDLGGGTFDVSLVRSRGGRLQVLDHDGDNHLGGRDFDRVIVRKAVEVVRAGGALGEFRRADPATADAFARLKGEAERARIALSTAATVEFAVDDLGGDKVGVRFVLEREEFEQLAAPLVERSTALCKQVLARNRLKARELTGLVLVGGPTYTPSVLRGLHWDVGVEARHVVDPMQIVAWGAALFAATQRLPSALAPRASGAIGVRLEYEPMTTNPQPLLVGVPDSSATPKVATARIVRGDEGFDSGYLPVGPRGFAIELPLRTGTLNVFRLGLYDAAKRPLPCDPQELSILHGFSVANPPLSQSVGVMLADNSVAWYLKRGTVLPARRTTRHATTIALARGGSGDAVNVPLVQGESERANRNKVIGVLRIHAEKITRDLPMGAEVQVTLTVDEFARTTGRAYVPLLDQWFEDIVFFGMESKEVSQVKDDLAKQKERLAALEAMADEAERSQERVQDPRLREIEALLEEGEGAGDGDAIAVAERLLNSVSTELDQSEEASRAKVMEKNAHAAIERARAIFSARSDGEELRQLAALESEFGAALAAGEAELAKDKLEALDNLEQQALMRVPEFWAAVFEDIAKRVERGGMGKVASATLADGRRAAATRSIPGMANACSELLKFLPTEERERVAVPRITSHVS